MQNHIPKNWQVTTLGGTATLNYGKGLPGTERSGGCVPVYGSSGVSGHHNQSLVKEEGYIIGRKGTVGTVYYSPDPFYPIDTVYYSARSDIKCDFKFFYYLLRTLRLDMLNSDSAIPGLNRDVAYAQLVLLPTLPEQERIACILSAFDDKIEVNNKIVETLEDMAQALFKEWFTKNISPDWETSKFENYARLEYGKALQEGRRIPGKVLVFGSSGKVGTHNKKLCIGPGVVVGRKGNVGSVFWVDEDFYPIDTTFFVNSKISLYYIYFILKNMKFHTGDSAVPGLNRYSVHNAEILIPEKTILEEFGKIVSPIFEKLTVLKKEDQKLVAMRDLLLPKLMKGEIRV